MPDRMEAELNAVQLPATLNRSDYLNLDFTGVDEFTLKPRRTYAFLLMFLDRAPLRGMTLANEYYGTYVPDAGNTFRGHGIRREGLPAFPEDWNSRLNNPMEYFAETSEAFFSRNDFFPFTRDELNTHDPEMFTLLAKRWGISDDASGNTKPETKGPSPATEEPNK